LYCGPVQYAYTSFGEMLGWLIGWNLTLEYAIGAAAVARSWSAYFSTMLTDFGLNVPGWLNSWDIGFTSASPLAAVIIVLCTGIMMFGAKDSAKFNNVVTGGFVFVSVRGLSPAVARSVMCSRSYQRGGAVLCDFCGRHQDQVGQLDVCER
jgi:hypothetical protein